MAVQVTKQIVVSEDGLNIIVSERMWTFATLLQSLSTPDRKVAQIRLFRMAYPEISLREGKMIIEAAQMQAE